MKPHLLLVLLCGGLALSAFPQGSLTPPAAPAPTMKTLDQIEPRKEINATNTPGDASNHFIITQPGSYYLSAALTTTGTKNGINIQADDVSLDLRGFAIVGTGAGGGKGIVVTGTRHRLHIFNGTVRNALIGIDAATALDSSYEHLDLANNAGDGLTTGSGALVDSCHASDNTQDGIQVESRSVVRNCTATGNDGTAGILTASGCTVSHCTSSNNDNASGISVGSGSVVVNCVADSNAQNGITNGSSAHTVIRDCSATGNTVYGIFVANFSTVSGCVAYNNGSNGIYGGGSNTISNCKAHQNDGHGIDCNGSISNCSASSNTGDGIRGFLGFSTISNCTCSNNTGNGIKLEGQSMALNNTCLGNGTGATTAAGILATGSHNRIEANNVSGNGIGIDVNNTGNLILRNSAGNNTTNNYDIVADNRYGVILDLTAAGTAAATGDSAAGTLTTTTNPWANFSY